MNPQYAVSSSALFQLLTQLIQVAAGVVMRSGRTEREMRDAAPGSAVMMRVSNTGVDMPAMRFRHGDRVEFGRVE